MMQRFVNSHSIRSLSRCSEALVTSSNYTGSAGAIVNRPQLQIKSFSSITTQNLSSVGSSRSVVVSARAQLPINSHYSQSRNFSSHDDFAPQKKEIDTDTDAIHNLIDSHVKGNRIMLYMKGSPAQPMCGFSATVVGILKSSGADFASVNVLDYPEVREGVKKYAQWPTIPQLYVDGEFIGGCDIITELDQSGELKEMLSSSNSDDGDGEKKD